MSALGQKQTCAMQKGMSALPPKAERLPSGARQHHRDGESRSRRKDRGDDQTRNIASRVRCHPGSERNAGELGDAANGIVYAGGETLLARLRRSPTPKSSMVLTNTAKETPSSVIGREHAEQ